MPALMPIVVLAVAPTAMLAVILTVVLVVAPTAKPAV